MLAMGVPLSTAFAVVAAPCVIAGMAVLALGVVRADAARMPAAKAIAGEQSEGGGARPPAGNQRGAILYKLI